MKPASLVWALPLDSSLPALALLDSLQWPASVWPLAPRAAYPGPVCLASAP